MKQLDLIVACLLSVMSLQAQESTGYFTDSMKSQSTTVNGLHLWGEYNYDQVVAALGKPLSYTDEISTVEESAGMRIQEYEYSSGSRYTFCNKHFTDFSIRSAKDSVSINGVLKVGDPLSKVLTVLKVDSDDYFYEKNENAHALGDALYVVLPELGGNSIRFYYSTNTITSIFYSTEE